MCVKPFWAPQRALHCAVNTRIILELAVLDDLLGSKDDRVDPRVIHGRPASVLHPYLNTTTCLSSGNSSLPLTEDLEAELNQEGRRTLGKERRQQTRGNKHPGHVGIVGMSAWTHKGHL